MRQKRQKSGAWERSCKKINYLGRFHGPSVAGRNKEMLGGKQEVGLEF
jgi:hypothetical protein